MIYFIWLHLASFTCTCTNTHVTFFHKVLNVLESKSLDDTDFEEDVEFLQEKLKLSLQDLRY